MLKPAMILFTALGLLLQQSFVYSQNCPGGNCAAPNQSTNNGTNDNSSNGSGASKGCANGNCPYGFGSVGGGTNASANQNNCNTCSANNYEYNCHSGQRRECSKCKGYPLPVELQRRDVAPLTPAPDL